MLSFDSALSNALYPKSTTSFWVLKLYYNAEGSSDFTGVSDIHRHDGTDIYYGLVSSWGSLQQSLDFFNFTTSTGNMSVKLINTHISIKGGRFSDLFSTNNYANRKWELFQNTAQAGTYDTAARMIGSGIISGDIAYDTKGVTFKLLDYSSRYHKQLPANIVDSTNYPNAPDKNINKPIPMNYGDFYERDGLGTIPTSFFDRHRHFYKGAFPAIVTDTFNVTDEKVVASLDSEPLNEVDTENIYFYKNGLYPTLTGSISDANPIIKFAGATASVYIPLSDSDSITNVVTGGTGGSASISSHALMVDDKFSTVSTIAADGGSITASALATFAVPKVQKLGDDATVYMIMKLGTVSGTFSASKQIQVDGSRFDNPEVVNDAELRDEVGTVGGYTSTNIDQWDFEKTIVAGVVSNAGQTAITAEIAQIGMEIAFTVTDIESHDFQEQYEETTFLGANMVTNYMDRDKDSFVQTIIKTRTKTFLTPTKVDLIYFSGKGREYGAWIDADSRNQGYNKGALIENPVFMIEDILRTELSTITTGTADATTSNKLVNTVTNGNPFNSSMVGQTVLNITDGTNAMITALDSGTVLSIDADIFASGEKYRIRGLTSSEIDYDSFDDSGDTSDGYLGDIYEDAVSDVKFAFSQYKFIDSKQLINRLCGQIFSWVFISGNGKFKIRTLRRTDDYDDEDKTINFNDINLKSISRTSLGNVRNDITINYNQDYGQNLFLKSANPTADSTSLGTTVNGYNQTLKFEMDADIADDDTAGATSGKGLADAYMEIFKKRKPILSFDCITPKYNDLEIGDIVKFSNWDSKIKIYGDAMGTDYYMITDISKSPNKSSLKIIKVS